MGISFRANNLCCRNSENFKAFSLKWKLIVDHILIDVDFAASNQIEPWQ